jgi:hypothetical protein
LARHLIYPTQGGTDNSLESIAGGATPAIIISSAVGISFFFCAPQQAR